MARQKEIPSAGSLIKDGIKTVAPVVAARAEVVSEAYKAGVGRLSKKGKFLAAIMLAMGLAGGASAATNHVVRPGIAAVAKVALGPAYQIRCQLPSGNFGTCKK